MARNKRLTRKLNWTRLESTNITAKLRKGELIEYTDENGVIHKMHFIGRSDNYHKFLKEEDFLELVKTQSDFERNKYLLADEDEFIKKIQEYKVKTGCQNIDCDCKDKNFDHYQFDFDHVEKSEKSYEVTDLMKKYKRSIKEKTKQKYIFLILMEIKKCQVLCVPCHRKKSYKEKYGEHIKIRNYESAANYLCDKGLSMEPILKINKIDLKTE